MFATPYKNYFLRIMLASDEECDVPFSLVVKILEAKDRKPIAKVYVSEPVRTRQEAIQRAFEIGMQWVDKTVALLSPAIPAAEKTIVRSRQIATELQFLFSRAADAVEHTQRLIDQSRQVSAICCTE